MTVTRVVEVTIPTVPTNLLPSASPEALDRHRWMRPWALDDGGFMPVCVQTMCVETPDRRIVVDTCFGPGPLPERMAARCNDGSFLSALSEAGFGRDDVDLVICTHLHVDHVGWNTMLEGGRRVPTFRRARYLISRLEFEYWNSLDEDRRTAASVVMFDASVGALMEHKVADLVEADHVVSGSIRLVPSPGHTAGHVSVLITSRGRRALITGDCVHSPVQFAEPDWATVIDFDAAMSSATRRRLLREYTDSDVLIIGTHFPHPTAGHLVMSGEGVTFRSTEVCE